MKPALFIRVDSMIFEAENDRIKRTGKNREPVVNKVCKSINEAKRVSRGIQIEADGKRLGLGSVMVQSI